MLDYLYRLFNENLLFKSYINDFEKQHAKISE